MRRSASSCRSSPSHPVMQRLERCGAEASCTMRLSINDDTTNIGRTMKHGGG